MSAELMRYYLDILNEQQKPQLDEGIMDSVKSLVPKIMKALGGNTVAQIAEKVKHVTGGDYTLNQDNAVKVAKALGFEEILKNKMGGSPQGQISEAWEETWEGKLIDFIQDLMLGTSAYLGMTGRYPGGPVLGRALIVLGVVLLMIAKTVHGARGMIGAMGRSGDKNTETEKVRDI